MHIHEVCRDFKGELWTQDKNSADRYDLNYILSEKAPGLGRETTIHTGENGGYQTVNLAYLFGAKKIVLLGFDMQMTKGQTHHHGPHPHPLNRFSPYSKWVKNFDTIARDLCDVGVEVINATRTTALTCFKKAKLKDTLC